MEIPNSVEGTTKVQGKFAVSIPTSLAFETLFGVNENITPTNPLPFVRYTYILINIRTLLRNIYSSVSKELKTRWTTKHYLDELLKELEIIPEIINQESKGKLSVVYYLDSYRDLAKEYPNAKLKPLKPTSSAVYESIEHTVTQVIYEQAVRKQLNIMLTNMYVPIPEDKNIRVAMMTHLPIDLVKHARSPKVDLLESHTGIIKDSMQWYTKLLTKAERVPFSRFSIQLFGDGKFFSGMLPRYRNAVVEFSKQQRWNQQTSDNLMKLTFSKITDKDAYTGLYPLF